jgi:hypothetical protein
MDGTIDEIGGGIVRLCVFVPDIAAPAPQSVAAAGAGA